ncbi:hypothetical protein GCM10011583_49220 [Streptomyces camponoticapitis]|uniref:Prenyltransferase n=1 Tax=Streptomyces camponoticapitis TaxID=1616125 RepID=A0ABQ2EGV9_9ACTN|nr:hypothetical protein [Streptomyces camponoticapitis]GGK11302.1 hypothetical protein GCM10011583_49220 [Streptomyces camponoticapitis]
MHFTHAPSLTGAIAFLTTHARLLDRRRFDLLRGTGTPSAVVTALDGYRNSDGGYGWALEPDLRSALSQPVGALLAFEVFEECAPAVFSRATQLCDWLGSISRPDGGLPFALPMSGADAAGSAPFWAGADPHVSSLHMTSELAAAAHRVGRHDPAVGDHPWLARATDFCQERIAGLDRPPPAIEFRFVLDLLDTIHGSHSWAPAELARLAAFLPRDGSPLPVEGGGEDESLRLLDFSPRPGRPLRELLDASVIAEELEQLAADQREDGGWSVDWTAHSPAAALEWRGYATVRALTILRDHGIPLAHER